ncbi:MAG: hypothetical protein KDE15_15195 [Erythrobacter sp.]|nr:hypothetical protein [Erythrobacter sp.]
MALSVLAFPRMVPANWDPATDFNAGRADFVALGFFGVALPAAYLIIAVPATLLFRILTKRRKAR